MFTFIKKLFSKKDNDADSYMLPDESSHNPNFVTEPTKITQILKAIEDQAGFCTIELNNSDETYTSNIIAVQENKNLIFINELRPEHGNPKLKQCKQLKLTTYLNNIHLSLVLKDLSAENSQHTTYYKAPLPERIYYPQRRKSPRISITTYQLTFQGTSSRNKFTIGGSAFDISRGGISLIIDNTIARIQRNDQLTNCVLILPDQSKIHFDLVIRFLKPYSNSRNKLMIGGYYCRVKSIKEQKQLEHFFALAERSEIRKQKDI